MKKLKQIWRYYFNAEIRAKKVEGILIEEHRQGFLTGMCSALHTFNYKTDKFYFKEKEVYILENLLETYGPQDIDYNTKYYFLEGELQPRLDWCDMVINKLKTKK